VTHQVVANEPGPRPIQELAFVLLVDNFGRAWQVEVEVGGHANSKTEIEPFARLFPLARRKGINRHEDVSLADLDALPAIDQSVGRRRLGEVHGDRVQLRAFLRSTGKIWRKLLRSVSLALSNEAIGSHTDSEEEGATTEGRRRRMDCLVKNGDKQLVERQLDSGESLLHRLTFIFLKKISKSLSTSAGVIRPVVIISGTLRLSMRILRRPRWATGPAFMFQRIITVVGP
jgi:hypothetical protein